MRRWIAIAAVLLLAACESASDEAPLPTVMALPTNQAVTPSTPLPPPTSQHLPFYEPMTGDIAAGEADSWEFSAQAGDEIAIRTVSASVVTHLQLLDPTGAVVAEGEDIALTLPSGGVFSLRVTAAQGDGEYQIGLRYADQDAPAEPTFTAPAPLIGVPTPTPPYTGLGTFTGELRAGETLPGEFQPAASPQVFTFAAQAGQYAHIALDPVSGNGDLMMTLYDPNIAAVAADGQSDNGAGILRDIRLYTDGVYSLRVTSNGQPATYTLTLTLRDHPVIITPTYFVTPTATLATPVQTPVYDEAQQGERLSPNQPEIAEISARNPVNTHSFAVSAGDVITVAVSPLGDSALIPFVEIIDPDGVTVGSITGTLSPFDRDAIVSPLVAALDGPYTLFVTGEGATTGEYTVAFGYGSTKEDIFKGEAQPDRANITAFTKRGVADVWHIFLTQGDLISAGVTPLDGNIIPVLEFYDSTGVLLGIDSQSGGARSPFISGVRAPQSGMYLLKVRPATAESIGQYQLVWRFLDLGATPTPVPGTLPLMTVEDSVLPEQYLFYPFQGSAGQQVIIAVRARGASTIDPVAAVIGPDGTVIGEGDDSAGTLDVYFPLTLPEDGTYQLRVNGYLSSGDFFATVVAVYQ